MNTEDRIARHRRMAESWYDGYGHFPERGELILSDEWRFTEEAVYWSPYFSGGRIHPVGRFFKTGPYGWSQYSGSHSVMIAV